MWDSEKSKEFEPKFVLSLVNFLAELGVSDIYLSLGHPMMARYRGEVRGVERVLEEVVAKRGEETKELAPVLDRIRKERELLTYTFVTYIAKNLWALQQVDSRYLSPLFAKRAMDVGLSLHRGYRARVHAFFSQAYLLGGEMVPEAMTEEEWYRIASALRYTIRIVPPIPNSIEELGLTPSLETQFLTQKGLYLIVGPTASGKTTTAAYLVQSTATKKPWHILTLEDPIEYLIHSQVSSGGALVHQREKGRDFQTFAEGMEQALRQSPDLIFVGEVRDVETLNWTLFLAEAGFTVIGTYHSSSFIETLQKVVASFPPEQRELASKRLGSVLRAVVAQRLVGTKGACA